jgi:hypothetical protein
LAQLPEEGERPRSRSTPARVAAVTALLLVACQRAPSRDAALTALTQSPLSHDTTTVVRRVWEDGPPWFSCAEVIAKFDGHADTAAVRDQVGNWRQLVLTGWLVLRDTSAGVVSDPGWCAARLTDLARLNARSWIAIEGEHFPAGHRRRGWTIPVGHEQVRVVARPVLTGKDTAVASFVVTVAVNANGMAIGADRDSLHREATLVRAGDEWRVVRVRELTNETDHP